MLRFIPAADHQGYDDWLRVGMSLFNTDPGLLNAWVDWSRGMASFNEAECLEKWETFSDYSGGRRCTIASLHRMAMDGGYREPKRERALHAVPDLDDAPPSPGLALDEAELDDATEIARAGEAMGLSKRLSEARGAFSIPLLLPPDLAAAVDLLQRPLPTDPLSAVMPVLAGLSGLLKIGWRVQINHGYSTPANLFVGMVGRSGVGKTPVTRVMVKNPARDIRKEAAWIRERPTRMGAAEQRCSKEGPDAAPQADCGPPPGLHHGIAQRSPDASGARGLGMLILRDELSGLLQSISLDARQGSGTGEAQLLELFDGEGYTGIRVGNDSGGIVRDYENCHVSIYGNIQPDLLRELINGDDTTGKFARFLFCRIPTRIMELSDEDPSDEELEAHAAAEAVLRDYAARLYALSPRVLKVEQEGRRRFNAWWRNHQQTLLLTSTPEVVRSLVGKTSAHAHRVAGMLHLLKVAAGEVNPPIRSAPQPWTSPWQSLIS